MPQAGLRYAAMSEFPGLWNKMFPAGLVVERAFSTGTSLPDADDSRRVRELLDQSPATVDRLDSKRFHAGRRSGGQPVDGVRTFLVPLQSSWTSYGRGAPDNDPAVRYRQMAAHHPRFGTEFECGSGRSSVVDRWCGHQASLFAGPTLAATRCGDFATSGLTKVRTSAHSARLGPSRRLARPPFASTPVSAVSVRDRRPRSNCHCADRRKSTRPFPHGVHPHTAAGDRRSRWGPPRPTR